MLLFLRVSFFELFQFLSLYNNASKPAWLMIEAFEEIESEEACGM